MNPIVYCEKCGMTRDCMKHQRAEFPPDAAKKWLKKRHGNCDGEIKYRAGLGGLRGHIVGQTKHADDGR